MNKKILLIDDEVTSLKLLQARLEKEGFQIVLARDGDVGLERAQKETPDLIVLDIDMPRMNGYFFINELRKLDGGSDIPVIVVTSHDDMKQTFESKGIKEYFVKPVDLDLLQKKIEELLS